MSHQVNISVGVGMDSRALVLAVWIVATREHATERSNDGTFGPRYCMDIISCDHMSAQTGE